MNNDFIFVDEFVSGIRWDAKYATWDNFTGKPVDGYAANRIVGTRALCLSLETARENAASLGFGLLLWDGYRPQSAVDCFLRWAKQPEDGRTKRKHYPHIDRSEIVEKGYVCAKSGHSRGSAIDLTLYHLADGTLVPMGGDFDLMDSVSHHGAKGITPVEARNRQTLCSIMEACGFVSYGCEWWHYTLNDYFVSIMPVYRKKKTTFTGKQDHISRSAGPQSASSLYNEFMHISMCKFIMEDDNHGELSRNFTIAKLRVQSAQSCCQCPKFARHHQRSL